MKQSNSLRTLLKSSVVMFLFIVAFWGTTTAQPTNYCNPTAPNTFTQPTYYYCWPAYYYQWYGYTAYYGSLIEEVGVYDQNGVQLMKNTTSQIQYNKIGTVDCFEYFGNKLAQVTPGETYKFQVKIRHIYGYAYSGYDYTYCSSTYYSVRLFIDWNADGDFFDAGEWYNNPSGSNPTPIWWAYRSATRPPTAPNNACPNPTVYDFMVKVPDNVEPAFARFRVMTGYYYPSSPNQEINYGYMIYYNSGQNPCVNGYAYDYVSYGYSYVYSQGETEDYTIEYQLPIKTTFPDDKAPNDLLKAGVTYDGTGGNPKPYVVFYSQQIAGMKMQFFINGPLPFDDEVYRAVNPSDGSDWIDIAGYTSYTMQKSKGVFSVNGDGSFRSPNGGVYNLTIIVRKPGTTDKVLKKSFTVSWPNDLAVIGISSPRAAGAPDYFQYPRENPIGFTFEYQNVGENNITKFKAIAEIYGPNGNLIKTMTKIYDVADGNPVLKRRDKAVISFDESFVTTQVGLYKVIAKGELLSADDDEAYNDRFRRLGYPEYYFSVQYEYQGAAKEVVFPKSNSEVIVHRPFRPIGLIQNVGLNDLSDIQAIFYYWKKSNPSNQKSVQTFVKEIPSGIQSNTSQATFPSITITEIGEYEGKFVINVPNDGDLSDNTLNVSFTVKPGLQGTYTVGKKYAGNSNNFETIAALNEALFLKGLSGSVVFEFTDDSYEVNSLFLDNPAWDLSSAILGLGYDKDADVYRTITFKPSAEKAASYGSIVFNLYSSNGQGIKFGTSSTNLNPYAIINQGLEPEVKAKYFNNGGYITFDGGPQKSFKFIINSDQAKHASVFYLDRGSHHITIKNCIIENGKEATYNLTWLPRATYNAADGFVFQKDVTTTVDGTFGYSAGIVNRNSVTNIQEEKEAGLKPIPNSFNTIEGNEIKNFGYGIISTGIGAYLDNNNSFFQMFNTNNRIAKNFINRVYGAGIFVGFEEGIEIAQNKIYKVNGGSTGYGILAGLPSSGSFFGYNNIDLKIYGNQINEVKSSGEAVGIKVLQSKVILANSDGSSFSIPSDKDDLNIYSNAIWDVQGLTASAYRGGIYLTTERKSTNTPDIPKIADYFITGATIANNTVIINNDNYNNSGFVAGIAVQNTSGLLFANNAIANLDDQNSSQVNTAFMIQSVRPDGENMVIDNNAYWVNSNASVVRYIELDNNSNIIELGYANEFATLERWKMYSGMDKTSVDNYNFVNDHIFTGYEPVYINIKSNPAPKGSSLNNRGLIIPQVKYDLFGVLRGQQGQAYDIGAIEFNGIPYLVDVQPYGLVKEGVRREAPGMPFSDGFYEMVGGATNFEAVIYNGGSNTQNQVPVTLELSVENPDGTFSPILTDTKYISTFPPATFAVVDYKLNDGVGTDFTPKSYYDLNKERAKQGLSQYSIPDQIKPMAANVSPLYRVKISSPLDENNNNNTYITEFRYYIKKSPYNLMTVGTSDLTDIATTDVDEIARKANLNNLNAALKDIGVYNDYSKDRFDIDYLYLPGWNPRSFDFTPYTTVIWSDGDYEKTGTNMNIYQFDALAKFLESGSSSLKKNLIIASQELARINRQYYGQEFLNKYMRLNNHYPSNPFGLNGNYDQNTIKGVNIAKNYEFLVQSTGITGDDYPKPGLLQIVDDKNQAKIGFIYTKLEQGKNGENDTEPYPNSERIMSVVTNTIEYNSIYLALDWRHFAKPQDVLRGVLDFLDHNGGYVLPVDLVSFDAQQAGKRVDLSWITSQEMNSAKFEVEKSSDNNSFNKIAEVPAKGNSHDLTKYGPVQDHNVEFGKSYTYRLKMVDKDGSYNYSDTRTVLLQSENGLIQLGEILPNPSSTESKLSLVLSNSTNLTIEVFNSVGTKMMTLVSGIKNAGSHELIIPTRELPQGSYTIVLTSGEVMITRQLNVVK